MRGVKNKLALIDELDQTDVKIAPLDENYDEAYQEYTEWMEE